MNREMPNTCKQSRRLTKTFIMKKIIIGFFVVLLAAATAFANSPQPKTVTDPLLYWFDAEGDFIGQELYSVMHDLCPNSGEVCASGYTGTETVNGKIVPNNSTPEIVRYP